MFEHFLRAQNPIYSNVLAELRAGDKRSHWMWFIFPQLTALGRSATALRYGLDDLQVAQDYLRHAVLGPRIRSWYLERFRRTILGELSLDQSLELYYALFGYDYNVEPKVGDLAAKGFSPDYVYRETKRSVASAAGKTKIYSGIGFDVPGSPPEDPEKIYQSVQKAFGAGAGGIVV